MAEVRISRKRHKVFIDDNYENMLVELHLASVAKIYNQ